MVHGDLPPRRVEVTVEWHAKPRRGAATRRALALGATALLAGLGALVIAEGPSGGSAAPPAIAARCERGETPRMFIGDSHPNLAIPVRLPGCP